MRGENHKEHAHDCMEHPGEVRGEYVDWAAPMEDFYRGLVRLRNHLRDHDLYEGVEQDVTDMDYAISLIGVIRADGYGPPYQDSSQKAWDELWPFLRDHMLKWWC